MTHRHSFWRQAAGIFHDRADEYDGWFEDSLLFRIELGAIRDLRTPWTGPLFELGVGPGRFAGALGVSMGVDPARAPLILAKERGVAAGQAIGEALPVRDKSLGTVFLLFTLCFLEHPGAVLAECRRVLKSDGHLVLGMVPASSPWGRSLAAKGEKGNPFYRHAAFHEPDAVRRWLADLGFRVKEARSTLLQPPGAVTGAEQSLAGIDPRAGFVILVAGRGQ